MIQPLPGGRAVTLDNVTSITYYSTGSLQILLPHFVKDLKSPLSEAVEIPALTKETQLEKQH